MGWSGLHATATAFASSPEITAFMNSPMDSFEAASRTTFPMIARIARCFEAWILRSVIAMGFTRTRQPSFVATSTVTSVRVRFRRVRRRM